MGGRDVWDVAIVGGGPAGLSAATAAARSGARTVVLEKARHPRYKTCGGGLIGPSMRALRELDVPVADTVSAAAFTYRGRRLITHSVGEVPLFVTTTRPEFDHALSRRAQEAGVTVLESTRVRDLAPDGDGTVRLRTDGGELAAKAVVGADGSASVTSRFVGARFEQVDVGLEVELAAPAALAGEWRGRILIDWGPIPGSYGWVFPKGDVLTVGVIGPRDRGPDLRTYLADLLTQTKLGGLPRVEDSGHLTRCRSADSPLHLGRVLLAGDAGGLMEPWTREGISFALRSGDIAGAAAARIAAGDPADAERHADGYRAAIAAGLGAEMAAGAQLLQVFRKHPRLLHTAIASSAGFRLFAEFCRGERSVDTMMRKRWIRRAVSAVS